MVAYGVTVVSREVTAAGEHPGLSPLIRRCVKGDRAAQREFVVTYQTYVYRVAHKLIGDPHQAEDLAQDVFIKVLQSLSSFKGETAIETWLYRVTFNRCMDHLRKRLPQPGLEAEALAEQLHATGPAPDIAIIEAETQRLVAQAVAELPDKFRLVYTLHHWEDMAYEEIAKLEKTSVSAIKMRVSRGRELLVNRLRSLWEKRK